MANITIYTDGSANNGTHDRGGYGIVLIKNDHSVKQYCGGQYCNTTSARMEMLGVIKALEKCTTQDRVTIYCDNRYVCDTIAFGWIDKWKRNDFQGKKNRDLLRQLLYHYNRLNRKVIIKWVKGHDGNPNNEIADLLAARGSKRQILIQDNRQ